MEEQKNKIEGWRKMGIAMGTISALVLIPDVDFKIAIIIGIIALYGITWQGILDYGKRPTKTN